MVLDSNFAKADKQLIDGVAAIIANDVITLSEVAMQLELELEKRSNSQELGIKKNMRDVLEEMVDKAVLANYARKKMGEKILSEPILKRAISRIRHGFNGSEDLLHSLIRRELLANIGRSLKPADISKRDWIKILKKKEEVRKFAKSMPDVLVKIPSARTQFG